MRLYQVIDVSIIQFLSSTFVQPQLSLSLAQQGPQPQSHQQLPGATVLSFPPPETAITMDLGNYRREGVTNVDVSETGRVYFDLGLRLMMSYQHEMASKCFLACLH